MGDSPHKNPRPHAFTYFNDGGRGGREEWGEEIQRILIFEVLLKGIF